MQRVSSPSPDAEAIEDCEMVREVERLKRCYEDTTDWVRLDRGCNERCHPGRRAAARDAASVRTRIALLLGETAELAVMCEGKEITIRDVVAERAPQAAAR